MGITRRIFVPLVIWIVLITAIGCGGAPHPVTIRYAAWNLGNPSENGLERRMIKAFMAAHPQIRVQIAADFVKDYNKAFKEAAATNSIPDAFMYAGNPVVNANGWCADLSDIVARDKDWYQIPQSFREAAQIKGKIIAIPSAMYFFGYFCNVGLLKKCKVDLLRPGFSIARFEAALEKTTDAKRGFFGVADESSIIEWYPAATNPRMGWYTWDGGKFNLDSPEFINGVHLAKSIVQKGQSYAFHMAQANKNPGAKDRDAWSAGRAAFKFDGTWAINDYRKLPFKVVFLGIPGGRTCIVPDFLFIAKRSKHPLETYQFIKYMAAYSREGFTKRMELAKANHLVVTSIPMVKDTDLLNKYINNLKMAGIREVYQRLNNNSYVEGVKVLPGYIQSRWEYSTNIKLGEKENAKIGEALIQTYRGDLAIEDIAPQLNAAANECLQIFPKQSDN